MDEPNMDEINLADKITSYIEANASWYRFIDVGLCLWHRDDQWRIVAGLVHLVPRQDGHLEEISLDYGDIILTRYQVKLKHIKKFVDEITNKRVFNHPEMGSIAIEGRLTAYSSESEISYYRHESKSRYGSYSSRWPYYYFDIGLNRDRQPPSVGLVRKGLPLFPSWFDGANEFLLLDNMKSDVQRAHSIPFIIPDPRARIDQIKMQGKMIYVDVEPGESTLNELLIKMYAAVEEKSVPNIEIILENKKTTYEFPFEPEVFSVYLINSDGDALDNRDVNLTWGGSRIPPGVVFERTEESLLQHLERGENQNIEYKRSLDEKASRDKIPKVISSFSNTSGGILFLGVDDEGIPQASIERTEADRITQILTEHVEPNVQFDTHSLEVNGYNILAIVVAEGEDKPYVVKGRGPFIRHNGTSRPANRNELFWLTETVDK